MALVSCKLPQRPRGLVLLHVEVFWIAVARTEPRDALGEGNQVERKVRPATHAGGRAPGRTSVDLGALL